MNDKKQRPKLKSECESAYEKGRIDERLALIAHLRRLQTKIVPRERGFTRSRYNKLQTQYETLEELIKELDLKDRIFER